MSICTVASSTLGATARHRHRSKSNVGLDYCSSAIGEPKRGEVVQHPLIWKLALQLHRMLPTRRWRLHSLCYRYWYAYRQAGPIPMLYCMVAQKNLGGLGL
jgi:hypothetical protein